MLNSKIHPSAEIIYELLKKDHPTISLATVYKTLHLLKEIGIIQQFDSIEGKIRYDSETHLHLNLVCSRCGEISDIASPTLEKSWNKIIEEIHEKIGTKPNGQLLNLYYLCSNCQKESILK